MMQRRGSTRNGERSGKGESRVCKKRRGGDHDAYLNRMLQSLGGMLSEGRGGGKEVWGVGGEGREWEEGEKGV